MMKEQLNENQKPNNKQKRLIKNSKMFLHKSMITWKPTLLDWEDNFVMMKERLNQNQESTNEQRGW
jgi:hypothetical protein